MFLIDTDALTIAPPEVSVIVPDKVPPTICEYIGADNARIKIKTEGQIEPGIMQTDMLRVMDPPCTVLSKKDQLLQPWDLWPIPPRALRSQVRHASRSAYLSPREGVTACLAHLNRA